MASMDNLTQSEEEFLAQCEEEFKDRYTDKDTEYMKVFNSQPSVPPIIESWWVPNPGRRNENRYNRSHQVYSRPNRDSGYNRRNHNNYNDNRDYGRYHPRY